MAGSKKRGRTSGPAASEASQSTQRPRYWLSPVDQVETVHPSGIKLRAIVFDVLDPNGAVLVTTTEAGPMKVQVRSVPIPVGRAIITPDLVDPGLTRRRS